MSAKETTVDERTLYGGQAVVEGVMMRSPHYFAVACRRRSTNEIVVKLEPVEKHLERWQWLNKPFLRGTLALVDAVTMGMKALTYAANIQMADEAISNGGTIGSTATATLPATAENQSINGITLGAALFIGLAFGYGIFWIIPTVITQCGQAAMGIRHLTIAGTILLNVIDGLIRISLFLLYITVIARMPHVQRVFQYHGAEHKSINTLESGKALTVENARAASRIHPRCGTNFIFIVLIVSIFVFSFFGRPNIFLRIPLHLLLLPVVAGLSFEVLKLAGRYRDKTWAKWLVAPGLATQYLTTRVPSDDQLEVALLALKSVWDKEQEEKTSLPDVAAAIA